MWFRLPHTSNARDRNNERNDDKETEKDIPQLLEKNANIIKL